MAPNTKDPATEQMWRFLVDEAWPQIPADVLGVTIPKAEREEILGTDLPLVRDSEQRI